MYAVLRDTLPARVYDASTTRRQSGLGDTPPEFVHGEFHCRTGKVFR